MIEFKDEYLEKIEDELKSEGFDSLDDDVKKRCCFNMQRNWE